MEVQRQHILVKKGSIIRCLNDQGENIVAELQEDICCWPEGIESYEVIQLEVIQNKE